MSREIALLPRRVIFAEHPRSTNHRRAYRQAKALSKIVQVISVETHRDPDITREALAEVAKPGDCIVTGGGDGVLTDVVTGNYGHDISIWPIRGGNANDFAMSLNGRKTAAQIMLQGVDVQFRPVQVITKHPDGTSKTAITPIYWGVGADGLASDNLNVRVRKTSNALTRTIGFQQGREFFSTWRTMAKYPGFFVVQDIDGEEKETHVQDVLGLHGPRIAKHGRPGVELWQPEMSVVTSYERGLGQTLLAMVKMQQGRLHGEMATEVSFRVRAVDEEIGYVPLQLGGEVDWLPDNTEVTASLAQPFITRTTRPPKL